MVRPVSRAVWSFFCDGLVRAVSRERILLLDQEPIGLVRPAPRAAVHANQSPAALQLLPEQLKLQVPVLQAAVNIVQAAPMCPCPTPSRCRRHIVPWEWFLRSCRIRVGGPQPARRGAYRRENSWGLSSPPSSSERHPTPAGNRSAIGLRRVFAPRTAGRRPADARSLRALPRGSAVTLKSRIDAVACKRAFAVSGSRAGHGRRL